MNGTTIRRSLSAVVLCLAGQGVFAGPAERPKPPRPVVMMRFSSEQTRSVSEWKGTAAAFAQNPGCCDEVWFSTGESFPALSWHRSHVDRLRVAAADVRALGIGVSLQFEATIGHGDLFPTAEEKKRFDKPWTGWTGPDGTECVYCSCPRQPGFLQRLTEISRLYAEISPSVVWVDDDLRVTSHKPVLGNDGPGCWCEKCVADFAAAEGRSWTRETLHAAWKQDEALRERWFEYSVGSLAEVACTIARVFRSVSPKTRVGLQTAIIHNRQTVVILRALQREMGGEKTCVRLGGGAYYDLTPFDQIAKSRRMVVNRARLGLEDVVDNWCTEIETYPRAYASRSVRSIALEAFSSIGWGFDSASLFVMDRRSETDQFYSEYLLGPLCSVTRFLNAYLADNEGTVPAGFTCPLAVDDMRPLAEDDVRYLMGLPVLPGLGTSWGEVSAEPQVFPHLGPVWGAIRTDRMTEYPKTPSAKIQAIRDGMSGSAPLKLCSPFVGVVFPRVDRQGCVRTVGLIGTRLDAQRNVVLQIDTPCTRAVWQELDAEPVELGARTADGHRRFVIPSVGAWNAGYLKLVD